MAACITGIAGPDNFWRRHQTHDNSTRRRRIDSKVLAASVQTGYQLSAIHIASLAVEIGFGATNICCLHAYDVLFTMDRYATQNGIWVNFYGQMIG